MESDNAYWINRAEDIAERYLLQAAIPGSPISLLLAGDNMKSTGSATTFHTITVSIPGDVPAEEFHQLVLKVYAERHALELTGDGLDWFLRHPKLDVPEFLKAPRRAPVPALLAVDEADLMEARP